MKSLGNRLTNIERFGYGMGSIGESTIYILYSFYALFFMTDIAKLDAVSAGAILSVSIIVSVFFNIYLGYKSDNCRSKAGRRIPFMRAAIVPAFVFSIMCFTAVDFSQTGRMIYYIIAILGIIGAHTLFVLPYEALGAEITDNLEDRNSMRNYAKFFMGVGTFLGLSLTSLMVDLFTSSGMDTKRAWQVTIIIVAGTATICLACAVIILKKKAGSRRPEISCTERTNIIKEYWDVLKIKPFRYLLTITALCSVNFAFSSPAMIYFMTYNMNLPGRYQSIVFIVITIANITLTPITAALAKKICKEKAMCVCFLVSGIALMVFTFLDVKSFNMLAVLVVISTIGNSAYYQLIFPMYYDISILDNNWNGKQREGTILSAAKTALRIFTALGTQLIAVMLACFGYDEMAPMQSDSVLVGIKAAFMLIPGILYLCASIIVYFYPITEKKIIELVR